MISTRGQSHWDGYHKPRASFDHLFPTTDLPLPAPNCQVHNYIKGSLLSRGSVDNCAIWHVFRLILLDIRKTFVYSKYTSFSEQRNMMNTPIGNRDLIRAINRSTVLNIIKTNGAISRTEIARISGLSAATVTGISADLIDEGLIFEKAEGNSSGGRRPILLAINPRGGYVVGIKLMEDHAIAAITDLEATIIAKHSKEFRDKSLENALNMLVESVNDLVFEVGIDQEQIFGIGIGLAGIVDARNGILHYSPYVGWHNVPLGDLLRDRLGVPVRIDNDVNTLTLTEQLFGAGQGIDNFLLVTIGRGVGLGIVVNGQLYRGINGGAGYPCRGSGRSSCRNPIG